jgi:hypothetical protein
MGGVQGKPDAGGAAKVKIVLNSGNNPPVIRDFLERRRRELQTLGLRGPEIEVLITDELRLGLENLTTVAAVNTVIHRFYSDTFLPEAEATPVEGELRGFGVEGLLKMKSSGKNFDCFIHSFLTATCDNFRRIAEPSKNEFANFFRRTVFLTLPTVRCFMEQEPGLGREMRQRIQAPGGVMLEEIELRLLAAQFKVNILAATGESKRFQPINAEALRAILPPACCDWPAEQERFRTTVSIYTSGVHFEALRDAEGYTFTEAKIADIIASSELAANARRGAGGAAIKANGPTKPEIEKAENALGLPRGSLAKITKKNLTEMLSAEAPIEAKVATAMGLEAANLAGTSRNDLKVMLLQMKPRQLIPLLAEGINTSGMEKSDLVNLILNMKGGSRNKTRRRKQTRRKRHT